MHPAIISLIAAGSVMFAYWLFCKLRALWRLRSVRKAAARNKRG